MASGQREGDLWGENEACARGLGGPRSRHGFPPPGPGWAPWAASRLRPAWPFNGVPPRPRRKEPREAVPKRRYEARSRLGPGRSRCHCRSWPPGPSTARGVARGALGGAKGSPVLANTARSGRSRGSSIGRPPRAPRDTGAPGPATPEPHGLRRPGRADAAAEGRAPPCPSQGPLGAVVPAPRAVPLPDKPGARRLPRTEARGPAVSSSTGRRSGPGGLRARRPPPEDYNSRPASRRHRPELPPRRRRAALWEP